MRTTDGEGLDEGPTRRQREIVEKPERCSTGLEADDGFGAAMSAGIGCALAKVDGATAARYIGRLQRTGGNASVQRALAAAPERAPRRGSPEEGEDEARARAGQVTGFDLSAAAIVRDSPLPAALHVDALTIDDQVHSAPGLWADRNHASHVLTHELTHVVQHSTGRASGAEDGAGWRALEDEAERSATLASDPLRDGIAGSSQKMQGTPLPPVPRSRHAITQLFDPRYHRLALVEGLVGRGFTAEEIGKMYAGNWERDLSQAHPSLGEVILAWKNLKIAAAESRLTQGEVSIFEGKVGAVVQLATTNPDNLLNDEGWGGYRFYEHMDNPGQDPALDPDDPSNKDDPTRRAAALALRTELLSVNPSQGIPQYMVDAREYIKQQLFRAASEYRGDMAGTGAEKVADAATARQLSLAGRMPQAGGVGKALPRSVSDEPTAAGDEAAIEARRIAAERQARGLNPDGTSPGGSGNGTAPGSTDGPGGSAVPTILPVSGPAFHAEVDKRFWAKTGYKVGKRLDQSLEEDKPFVRIWLKVRDEVRQERTELNAKEKARVAARSKPVPVGVGAGGAGGGAGPGGATTPGPGARPGTFNAIVGDAMGRASHSLEDYFSHSNFVELAIGEPNVMVMGASGAVQGSEKPGGLGTATFGAVDKKHALAHKIRAVADEIESELPLVNRVAHGGPTPGPGDVNVGSDARPRDVPEPSWWDTIKTGGRLVGKIVGPVAGGAATGAFLGGRIGSLLGPLGALAGGVLGGIAGGAAGFFGSGGMEGLRGRITEAVGSVVATPEGARMLKHVAELLEDSTRDKAQQGSHTLIAKDQPGHDVDPFEKLRKIKFELANALASAADREVLGPMRQAFDAPTPAQADTILEGVYKKLDAMIKPPTGHPLEASVIEPKRAAAKKAVEEYLKWKAEGGASEHHH